MRTTRDLSRAGRLAGVLVAVALAGCSGRGCGGSRDAEGVPAATPPAGAVAAAPSPAPVSGPPAGRMDDLAEVAPLLPVSARVVATFPADDVRAVALSFPALWPVTVRTDEEARFALRVKTLWGLDVGSLNGACAVAVMATEGVVATCARGVVAPVAGTHRWRDGEAEGAIVRRKGRELWVGTLGPGGRPVAGDAAAVQAVIAAWRKQAPSLADALGRRHDQMRELAGADGFKRSALWFPDRAAAPWCGDGCAATAIFWSLEGYTGIALADPGRGEAVRASTQAWWNGVRRDFDGVAARSGREDDAAAVPPEATKRADEPARSAEVVQRGDRVLVSGKGDVAWLALALNGDLPGWFFGEDRVGP